MKTAPHVPLWRLWRLSLGLSNPKQRLVSSEAKDAPWKAAGRSAQNEASPLKTNRQLQPSLLLHSVPAEVVPATAGCQPTAKQVMCCEYVMRGWG